MGGSFSVRGSPDWQLISDHEMRTAFADAVRRLHPTCAGPALLDDELAFSLVDRDNNAFLDEQELQRVVKQYMGKHLVRWQIKHLMARLDADKDGKVG